jgi:O-antigen ligase
LSALFRPKILLGGGIAVSGIVAVALQFEYVVGQFQSFYDLYLIASEVSLQMDLSTFETSGSNLARLYVLLFAVRTTMAHPLFGVGTGRWHEALAKTAETEDSRYLIGAHSEYQRFAVENGLPGLGLYLTSWIVAAQRAVRSYRACIPSARESTLTILGIVVFGAIINLFLGGGALNIVYLALATGLLVGLDNDGESLPR